VQAQLTLGRILRITGDRENAGPKLEKALQLIQAVENYYSSSSVSDPFIRAQMQYELGKTLQILGTGDTNTIGTSRLKEAIKRLYEALNVWTPKTNPVGWAQAHLAIGAALTALGTREECTSRFQQAAKVYRAALSIVTRKNMPWVWAGLHYSLAITLFWSSEKERSPQQLCESFIHMREAWYTFSDSGSNLNSSEAQAQIVRITNTFERRYSKKQFSECLSGSIRRL
jgi:tetratricopeptide (TPR) repeat protein